MRSWRCSVPTNTVAIRPATLVDSCVLLDIITGDDQWADWSAAQLAAAMDFGRVVINPLVYAEVSVSYQTLEVGAGGELQQKCFTVIRSFPGSYCSKRVLLQFPPPHRWRPRSGWCRRQQRRP